MQVANEMPIRTGSEGGAYASTRRGASGAARRVGPNTLIQTLDAVRREHGNSWAVFVMARAGIPDPLPQTMVDERLFATLVSRLLDEFGIDETRTLLAHAGDGTGRYVLDHRIPRVAKGALAVLPARIGLRALMRAIRAHAWTFTGSGRFAYRVAPAGAEFTLDPSLVCEVAGAAPVPMGTYYARAFRTLVRGLVDPQAVVEEVECVCNGAPRCRFRILLPSCDPNPAAAPRPE